MYPQATAVYEPADTDPLGFVETWRNAATGEERQDFVAVPVSCGRMPRRIERLEILPDGTARMVEIDLTAGQPVTLRVRPLSAR